MYQEKYYIAKVSGFYQETLEAFGFARLLDMILNKDVNLKSDIKILNKENYYEIEIVDFDKNDFEQKFNTFCKDPQIGFEYIFKQTNPQKGGTAKPLDIKTQKELNIPIFDISKEWEVIKNYNHKDTSENQKAPHPYFNIYELLSNFSIEFVSAPHIGGTKQAGMFTRTYLQLYYNRVYFKNFLDGIFFLFSSIENQLDKTQYLKFIELSFPIKENNDTIEYTVLSNNHKISKTTYNQLLNPNMSKGINSEKLKLSELSGEPEILREYLKILGTFHSMFSIGGNKNLDDYRVYVSTPREIDFILQTEIIRKFKKIFFTNSTYKADIYASILFAKTLIEHLEIEKENLFDFDYTPTNYIEGFYMCHFMTMKKSPPKKHAPMNFAFIALPKFIKAINKEKADESIEILESLYKIIRTIRGTEKTEETGEIVRGLNFFRDFISVSKLESFFDFSFWYSSYIIRKLYEKDKERNTGKPIYVLPFNESLLNKIYNNMELNLLEIIQNEGFRAITMAIRKSTISLQYTPSDQRKFEIRYGLAQQLQNKSKSKEDLRIFVGEFIGTYNAETGRYAEKNGGKAPRANVKDSELDMFFTILDTPQYSSRLVGALLASYGFALAKKDVESNKVLKLQEDAAKLGYQLVKTETEPIIPAQEETDENSDNAENV